MTVGDGFLLVACTRLLDTVQAELGSARDSGKDQRAFLPPAALGRAVPTGLGSHSDWAANQGASVPPIVTMCVGRYSGFRRLASPTTYIALPFGQLRLAIRVHMNLPIHGNASQSTKKLPVQVGYYMLRN